ncbi:MAG: primosomal protein N' [Spirochaetaceae bacterium]|nr:MAG: primosomal protein N' [Spirochaetaceae bacterium]
MNRLIEVVFNLPIHQKFTYAVAEGQEITTGYRVLVPFGSRRLTGYVVGTTDAPPPGVAEIKQIQRPVDKRPLFDANLLELAAWLSEMYLCSLGEALSAMLPGGRRGVEPEEMGGELAISKDITLSTHQRKAIERITAADGGLFYLHGVTGSGKTEVFLQVSRELLARGRGVIYLVPEISLTHQVVDVFQAFLNQPVAVLHSGLTPSQRLKTWLDLLDGDLKLVIGARSAVFAPVQNLGLIIVDEEHEGSYKSGTTPRYHARQVAMYRSRRDKAALIMGSATPSLEAYHYMHAGKLERLSLPERLSGGSMPVVRIQDLNGESVPLSKSLIREIRRTHEEGRQSILFLNRRGFSYFFHCHSCGFEMKCRNCSVSLTFHKQKNSMVCHYCGYRSQPVDVCPECGSMEVGYSGFGTERIEEEIQRLFPDLTVRRVDTDSVRNKLRLKEILNEFYAGRIDILLGTQMVAKGLNFPGVKLVGIVSADTGLQLPDFRAAERTFDLIVQVSGRAGRFHPDGKVLVQTYLPNNETIHLAARADLDTFFKKELQVRKDLGFPPFTRLIRLVFRARSGAKSRAAASAFAESLPDPEQAGNGVEVLGPVECPLAVIAGNHRNHLIFRSRHFKSLHSLVRRSLERFQVPAGVYVEVDVDPVSLL